MDELANGGAEDSHECALAVGGWPARDSAMQTWSPLDGGTGIHPAHAKTNRQLHARWSPQRQCPRAHGRYGHVGRPEATSAGGGPPRRGAPGTTGVLPARAKIRQLHALRTPRLRCPRAHDRNGRLVVAQDPPLGRARTWGAVARWRGDQQPARWAVSSR